MTDLLRRWVNGLITEIMQGPHGLPDGVTVLIQDVGPEEFRVRYADDDGRPIQLAGPGYVTRTPVVHDQVYGLVDCVKRGGQYDGAFEVAIADAKKGYGPLLYDVAMEYASEKGGGLMADRHTVSDAALNVWRRYMQRPDVVTHEMPDNETWSEPPLSLRFTKEPATIRRLEALGKLVHGSAKKRRAE